MPHQHFVVGSPGALYRSEDRPLTSYVQGTDAHTDLCDRVDRLMLSIPARLLRNHGMMRGSDGASWRTVDGTPLPPGGVVELSLALYRDPEIRRLFDAIGLTMHGGTQ